MHVRMQSHIGCICLTFLCCVFSNVSSNRLPERMHNWLVTFVWLSSTVSFQMCLQMTGIDGCIITLFNSIQFIAKAKATYWKWGCFWGLGGSQKPLRFLQGVSNSLATACNDFRAARAAFTAMAYLGCSKMLKINLNIHGIAWELSLVSCRWFCGRRKKTKNKKEKDISA